MSTLDVMKYMLSQPLLRGRMIKWSVYLLQFDLVYVPQRAMKGQVIANFLADHPCMDLPESEEEKTSSWKMIGKPHRSKSPERGDLWGFAAGSQSGKRTVPVQVCYAAPLPPEGKGMMKAIRRVRIAHIPREENAMAKKLAQRASRYDLMFDDDLLGVRITQRQIQVKDEVVQVFGLNILESESDWRSEIIKFLKDPSMKGINLKLKRQLYRYFLTEYELYKKDSQGILLKCLNSDDALLAMTEIHEGVCGAHQSGVKMRWLLHRHGYF
ncbi:hypothetical protein RND81_03G028600 [Saponaria officinalis]|uniref:Reverse transcriptase n=1 Tax=Saponaria officinalis TaxID=3572 RepID=A0AAW1M734_SAPOF